MTAAKKSELDREQVVVEAIINLVEQMNIGNAELSEILGVNPSTVHRMKKSFKVNDKRVMESALHLIRIYRSLYSIYSGNKDAMIHWLRTDNKHLNGVPVSLIQKMDGLVLTTRYLDSLRGKI